MWGFRRRFDQRRWEDLNEQVILLTRERKLPEAAALATEAAESSRRSFGTRSANTMKSLNNLGMIEILLDRFDAAESHLLAALEICERLGAKEDPEAAVVSANLARLFEARAGQGHRLEQAGGGCSGT